MSVLPSGGSIVVIDDSFAEANPLIQLLSKENKACRYFDGKGSSLPSDDKFETTRLIFLDYNLTSGTTGSNNISTIVSNLNRLIDKNNGPYFIFLWSKNQNDADEFVQELNRYIADFPHLKPHNVKAIEKLNYFEQAEDKWRFISDKQEELRREIQTAIEELALLEFFSKWENQVVLASQRLTSKVADTVNCSQESADSVAKILVHHLAKINLEQSINSVKDSDIAAAAYQTLNTVFATYLNHKSGELRLENDEFKDLNSLSSSSSIDKGKFNSWLNINQLPNPSHLGEVFALKTTEFYDCNIVTNHENRGSFIQRARRLKSSEDYFKIVELEVSPECDIAQNKRKFYRIIPGVLVSVGLLKKIYNDLPSKLGKDEKNKYYIYCFGKDKSDKSDTPKTVLKLNAPQTVFGTKEFELKDNGTTHAVVLILDLSQFKTVPMVVNGKDYFENKESLFSLNSDLLQAIKNLLANNIQKKGYQGL